MYSDSVSITEGEILNAIKGLKRNKSHGSDGMLNEYFIEYTDILLPFLYKIFNAMLDTGVFPSVLCDALIVPVHKKGSMSDPKNYRGISLISCLCKLFTSIVNRRLYCHGFIDYKQAFDSVDRIKLWHKVSNWA